MSNPVEYQSLSKSPIVDTIDPTHQLFFLVDGQVRRITHLHYTSQVLGTFPERVTHIEETLSAGPLPSVWPTGRTLSLGGVLQGSVTFDGSGDIVLEAAAQESSLPIASISGLGLKLLSLRETNIRQNTRLDGLTPKRVVGTDVFHAAKERYRFSGTDLPNQPPGSQTFTYSSSHHLSQETDSEHVAVFALSMTTPADTFVGIGVETSISRTLQWYRIWNEANFNPDRKAERHNPSITGTANFEEKIQTVDLVSTGSVDHYGDVNLRKGLSFWLDSKKLLSVKINEDGEDGYFIDYGHFAAQARVRLRFSVPGHVLMIGGEAGLRYNTHVVWHAGNFNPASKLNNDAAALTADRLTRPFTLSLDGALQGSAELDGSGNVALKVTIPSDSLTFQQVAGLENALQSKFGKDGGVVRGAIQFFNGVVTVPQTFLSFGWSDQKPKWVIHLNTDGHFHIQEVAANGTDVSDRLKLTDTTLEHEGPIATKGQNAALEFDDVKTGEKIRLYADDKIVRLHNAAIEFVSWDRSGRLIASQVVLRRSEGVRFSAGDYGLIFKSNGQEFNLLLTERYQSLDGAANALRPFRMQLSTGAISSTSSWSIENFVHAQRLSAGWDAGVTGSISCSNWFRASGQSGIYFNDYGGGWHMTDGTTIRTLNNKHVAGRSFIELSDLRYKSDVRPFEFKGRLNPISYSMFGKPTFGFGAQDLIPSYPEVVFYNAETDTFEVRYSGLLPVISFQVNRAEDDIIALKERVSALEKTNQTLTQLCQDLLEKLEKTS